jgi:hypothetical protein
MCRRTQPCVNTRKYQRVLVLVCVCTYVRMYICIYVCTYVRSMYVRTFVSTYVCVMYVRMHVCNVMYVRTKYVGRHTGLQQLWHERLTTEVERLILFG